MTKETLIKIKMGFAGLTLSGSLMLTGCSGVQNPLQMDPVRTVQPAEVKQVKVTDEFGTYTRDTYVPSSVSWDSGTIPSSSKNDAKDIQDWITNFVLTEALDSIALDNSKKWEEWKSEVSPRYISSKYMDRIFNSDGYVILADGKNPNTDLVPTLARDGNARLSNKKIVTAQISQNPDNKNMYYVGITGTMRASVADEEMMKWDLANMDGPAADAVKDYYKNQPMFQDGGKPEKIASDFSLNYTIIKENGSWKIAGFDNNFGLSSITD